jgi:hypothetical protein
MTNDNQTLMSAIDALRQKQKSHPDCFSSHDRKDLDALIHTTNWLLGEASRSDLNEERHWQAFDRVHSLLRKLEKKWDNYQCEQKKRRDYLREQDAKFNSNHKPAGSPEGGQFDFGPGGGGGSSGGGSDGGSGTGSPRTSPSGGNKPAGGSPHPELHVTHEIPPHAQYYLSLSGGAFHAPAETNWQVIVDAGKAHGPLNYEAGKAAIGQGGTFDFQRLDASKGIFYSKYIDASNYAVGLYMYGAGYSESEMVSVAGAYSLRHSTNPMSDQLPFWQMGWRDASAKRYPIKVGNPIKPKN